jgi:phytoene synthase
MPQESQIVQSAYEHCLKQARSHYENFPVVSPIFPRRQRLALAAIYAFARQADDYAGEPAFEGSREELLDEWEAQLDRPPEGPVFVALQDARERFHIPVELLKDLVKAFRQDATVRRYPSYASLLEYCRCAANPIGRMILRLFNKDTLDAVRESDAICTALQLTNFWQGLSVDFFQKDRLYLPQDECGEFGVPEVDLKQKRFTPNLTRLIAFQTARARELFLSGAGLPWHVKGRLGLELKMTLVGGLEILRKIEEQGFNPFVNRPKVEDKDWLKLLWRAFLPIR